VAERRRLVRRSQLRRSGRDEGDMVRSVREQSRLDVDDNLDHHNPVGSVLDDHVIVGNGLDFAMNGLTLATFFAGKKSRQNPLGTAGNNPDFLHTSDQKKPCIPEKQDLFQESHQQLGFITAFNPDRNTF